MNTAELELWTFNMQEQSLYNQTNWFNTGINQHTASFGTKDLH